MCVLHKPNRLIAIFALAEMEHSNLFICTVFNFII